MCDRGANLIKALQGYEVLFCFAHRLNNVLKRGFFQSKTNRTSTKTPKTATSVAATTTSAVDIDSNHSSSSNSSTEEDEEVLVPTRKIKKKKQKQKQKQQSSVTNDDNQMKLNFNDLSVKAQEIIETIKQCKKLVRYIKKVVYFFFS